MSQSPFKKGWAGVWRLGIALTFLPSPVLSKPAFRRIAGSRAPDAFLCSALAERPTQIAPEIGASPGVTGPPARTARLISRRGFFPVAAAAPLAAYGHATAASVEERLRNFLTAQNAFIHAVQGEQFRNKPLPPSILQQYADAADALPASAQRLCLAMTYGYDYWKKLGAGWIHQPSFPEWNARLIAAWDTFNDDVLKDAGLYVLSWADESTGLIERLIFYRIMPPVEIPTAWPTRIERFGLNVKIGYLQRVRNSGELPKAYRAAAEPWLKKDGTVFRMTDFQTTDPHFSWIVANDVLRDFRSLMSALVNKQFPGPVLIFRVCSDWLAKHLRPRWEDESHRPSLEAQYLEGLAWWQWGEAAYMKWGKPPRLEEWGVSPADQAAFGPERLRILMQRVAAMLASLVFSPEPTIPLVSMARRFSEVCGTTRVDEWIRENAILCTNYVLRMASKVSLKLTNKNASFADEALSTLLSMPASDLKQLLLPKFKSVLSLPGEPDDPSSPSILQAAA